jgi:hypothetical protein
MTLPAPQQPSGSKDAPAGSIKSNAADPTASIGSPKITIPFFRMCLSSLLLLPGFKAIQKRSPAIFPRIVSRLPRPGQHNSAPPLFTATAPTFLEKILATCVFGSKMRRSFSRFFILLLTYQLHGGK